MSRQLGNQTGTQASKSMGVIALNMKLLSQLSIDRFDNLAHGVEGTADRRGHLNLLIDAREGQQAQTIKVQQTRCDLGAKVAFVPVHLQIGVLFEQFASYF